MALHNVEDTEFIQLEIPFHKDCPDFVQFTKNINQIQLETQTKIKLQQIVHIVGKGDDVKEARRRVGQLNDNLGQIRKKIEDLEREKIEMARASSTLFQDNMDLLKDDLQTQIKEMNSTFEKITEEVEKVQSALINQEFHESTHSIEDESEEVKSTLTTIQDKVSSKLDISENLLEPFNMMSEEIKKLVINVGHALKLDIQNNGTRLKDAFEKMETNIKLSNKIMAAMVNKQLQFKTNAVTKKILEMVANNINVQENSENEARTEEKDLMDYVDLDTFYKSSEFIDCINNGNKRLPIHCACKLGRVDIVKKLIKNGTSINLKNIGLWTPLHFACYDGHLNVVRFLLDNNATIDDQDLKGGNTPLFWSVYERHEHVVEYLCSKNANVHIKNKSYITALDVAISKNYSEIIDILKKYGA